MRLIAGMVLTVFFTSTVFAQDSIEVVPSSDIGLRLSVGSQKQISFDYRSYLKNDLKLVFGADYMNSSSFPGNPKVISASPDSVQFEQMFQDIARPTLRVGIEKNLKKWPNLYGGVHLTVGYQHSNTKYSTYTDTLSENGKWETVFELEDYNQGLTNYKNHFLSTGAVLMAGWDVPISEHFIFNLNITQTFEVVTQVGEYQVTPNGSYAGNSTIFNADARLGLGLRYQF